MTDRVHVKAELELFVEDVDAMRHSAFERLRAAWSGDDEFPYESADDVPLEQVVASVLADALPIEFPGARRSALSVEVEARGSDDEDTSDDEDEASKDDEDTSDDDSSDEDTSGDEDESSSGDEDESSSSGG
jgi:hypothetical protein